MCACAYACVYECMYVCVVCLHYVCIDVYMYVCVYVCVLFVWLLQVVGIRVAMYSCTLRMYVSV